MIINSNYSLRKITLAKIYDAHEDLRDSESSSRFKLHLKSLSGRNSWLSVLAHVIILFVLFTFINHLLWPLLHLDHKSSSIIIDQRTSNVATIISMTLAVVGLLLSNLAIKDSTSYKILFVNSRMYLIIYYTLSTIACLMATSALRDTINQNLFDKLVLSGTYMSITILFGVGYLFRTIILFANAENIKSLLKNELLKEAKSNIRLTLLEKYSKKQFTEFFKDFHIKYNPAIDTPTGMEPKLIHDINIYRLKEVLIADESKEIKSITINPQLNTISRHHLQLFTPVLKGKKGKIASLKGCLVLRNQSKALKPSSEYKEYFRKQLLIYTEEGKSKAVAETLDTILDIYILQIKYN